MSVETNPYLAIVKGIQAKVADGSMSLPTFETLDDYGLGGYNCKVCNNTGMITWKDDKSVLHSKECFCMSIRRSKKFIRESGLEDLFTKYSFDTYEEVDEKRAKIKKNAMEYASANSGWYFVGGRSGSGKTHICTAICKALIERGVEIKYIVWRDFTREMKSLINEEEYGEKIRKLEKVNTLYIDDFWKGNITEADKNLAFELINARYIKSNLRTIISSELTINKILEIDEAIGGRIKEKSRGFQGSAPDENFRLR